MIRRFTLASMAILLALLLCLPAVGSSKWGGTYGAGAGGFPTWSGGYGVWSGGHGSWAGGYGVWSGGHGSWAG